MENLEAQIAQELYNVRYLKNDLSATRMVQIIEEAQITTNIGACSDAAYNRMCMGGDPYSSTVREKPEPDTEKQQAAKRALENIYNASPHYSARYNASQALFEDCNDLAKWTMELAAQLNQQDKAQTARIELYSLYHQSRKKEEQEQRKKISELLNIPNIGFLGRELEIGMRLEPSELITIYLSEESSKLSRKLARGNLKKVYNHCADTNLRRKIGNTLGYSKLRVWFHERKFKKTNKDPGLILSAKDSDSAQTIPLGTPSQNQEEQTTPGHSDCGCYFHESGCNCGADGRSHCDNR